MMFGTSRDYGKNVGGSNRPFFLPGIQGWDASRQADFFENARCFASGVFLSGLCGRANKKGGPKAAFLELNR